MRLAFAGSAMCLASACTFAGDPLPIVYPDASVAPDAAELPDAGQLELHGVLDPYFGESGVASDFRGGIAGLAMAADETIYVSGTYFSNGGHGMAVAHYFRDGDLDLTFGTEGIVDTTRVPFLTDSAAGVQVLVRNDNAILALGHGTLPDREDFHGILMVALDGHGDFDGDFGEEGRLFRTVTSSAAVPVDAVLAADGSVGIAGFVPGDPPNPFIARFSELGALTGAVMYGTRSRILGIAAQPDGKLIAGGYTFVPGVSQDVLVMRTDSKGVIDPSFGNQGRFVVDLEVTDVVSDVAVQPDGKIVVIGNTLDDIGEPRAFMLRLLDDGQIDPDFGVGGILEVVNAFGLVAAEQVVVAPDGTILVAGEARFDSVARAMLMRFDANGTVDPTFGYEGTLLFDMLETPTYVSRIMIDPHGRILVAGVQGDVIRFFLVRVLP